MMGCSKPQIITMITIRDADFKVITVLDTENQIKTFDSLWKSKIKLDSPIKTRWLYKIDIEDQDNRGGRWLYDKEGYIQLLDIFKQPTYKVRSADEFNSLIGIPNSNIK